MPTSKKPNSKRTPPAPAQRTDAPPFPCNLPMFFRGKRQSDEFARGACAARDATAKVQAHEPVGSAFEELTFEHADEFNEHVSKGGDYSRGFVTAIVEFIAFEHCVGGPNMEVWRPLEMPLLYPDGVHTQPTPGSKLYELDGEPVTVAPDCTVHVWNDADADRADREEAFLNRVQKHGRVVSQQEFDALRAKISSVGSSARQIGAPAEIDEDRTMRSSPIELEGHPAHDRISCATLGVHQLVVLTSELVEHVSAEPADEGAFVAMALASRAHTLARAANRLLSLPANEIDFEACEAEVCLG